MTWAPAQPICLDISNYQPAIIPSAWWDSGVTRLIVGCQSTSHAISQCSSGRNLGMSLDLYSFGTTTNADDVPGGTRNAIQVANYIGDIHRIWIDCERAALTYSQIAEAVDAITTAGYQPGIYTGPFYWRDHLSNTADFSHLPLWLADYFWSGLPWAKDFNPSTLGLPWTTLSVHQYTSTGTRNDNASGGVTPSFAGIDVDYNVYYLEDNMDAETKAKFDEFNSALQARFKLMTLANDPDIEKVKSAVAKIGL